MEEWPICQDCGDDEVNPRRWQAGYRTCLACGEARANRAKARKAKACVVTHKSNVMYLGEGEAAKRLMLDISTMRRGTG